MNKLKVMPRLAKEIIITVISFVVLCLLWTFLIEEYIVLSDQGLSTIGIALSTSIGVLTAIVVSFVLIVWQTSRRDRNESFLRWRNTLHQFSEFYDSHLEKLMEVWKSVTTLFNEASAVAAMTPMNFRRFKELVSPISDTVTEYAKQTQNIQNPSPEQVEKARLYAYMGNYIVMLAHMNFEHIIAHNLYNGILALRGLLYRLLSILIICIVVVAIAATETSAGISDVFNAPLALILVAWAIYLLVHLGIEIKGFTRLEDEFRRKESETIDDSQGQEKSSL